MNLKIKKSSVAFVLVSLFFCVGFLFLIQTVSAAEYQRLNKEYNNNLTFHGICREVKNNSSSNEYFIPGRTSNEWQKFIQNHPGDVAINTINGGWSEYTCSGFGGCSATCGGGTQTQTCWRNCNNPNTCGGSDCSGNSSETRSQSCNTQPCPVNCSGYWNLNAGTCSKTCGGGFYDKQWVTTVSPAYGGSACPSPAFFDNGGNSCNTQPCPVNCSGYWNLLAGTCSKTCGGGLYDKQFVMTTAPANGGTPCPNPSFIDNGGYACNTQACPVNCAGYWNLTAGTCSKTCGGGLYDKQFVMTTAPANGGTPCPNPSFIDNGGSACNTQACCVPRTCASLGCGTHSDGCGGTINCGACCMPRTCAGLGCGYQSDGCGGTIYCGSCCVSNQGQTCVKDNRICGSSNVTACVYAPLCGMWYRGSCIGDCNYPHRYCTCSYSQNTYCPVYGTIQCDGSCR